jgi:hypothetical protein
MKIEKRFRDLANLLVQIMVEESPVVDVKIPRFVVDATARALQRGYAEGEYKEDKDGMLYYAGMIEDFGGYIDNEIQKQDKLWRTQAQMVKKFLNKNNY